MWEWNPTFPSAAQSFEEIQGAAPVLGLQLHSMEVRRADDLERLFEAAMHERAEGLVVLTDAMLLRPSPAWSPSCGRQGLHTEAFGYMLA